jgi:hypothetical protein
VAQEDFNTADLDAARKRLAGLDKEREAAQRHITLNRVKSLEDFERLSGEERTELYKQDAAAYQGFMEQKASVWRERLRRGNAHLDAHLEARRKGEAR